MMRFASSPASYVSNFFRAHSRLIFSGKMAAETARLFLKR